MKKLLNNRALRQGSAAAVITVLAIVLVILLNMVVGALATRFNLSLDLTPNNVFSLSKETKEFILSVDKPVNITVFTTYDNFAGTNLYYQQAAEMMNGFGQSNPNISVTYVDILKNPAYASQYPDLELSSSNILVECEGRTQKLAISDLFNTQFDSSTYQTYITSSRAEQAMASAILNVTSEEKIKVAVLQGHNEVDVSGFISTLELNGFEAATYNLMTDEIDPEATIAVMAAPGRDITEDESVKLDNWLNNGGRYGKTLFYLGAPTQPDDTPVLDTFLGDWGIKIDPGTVYETNAGNRFTYNYSPSYFYTLTNYAESDYSADVAAKNLRVSLPVARPLEVLFDAKGSTTVTTLLEFSETSGVQPNDADSSWQPTETSGPIPALVMAQRTAYDQLTPLTSTVLASGSAAMLDQNFLGSPNFANSEYLVNLLSKLAGREQTFSVQNKVIERTQLGITQGQADAMLYIFAIALPLLVIAGGIVVWLRRRHR